MSLLCAVSMSSAMLTDNPSSSDGPEDTHWQGVMDWAREKYKRLVSQEGDNGWSPFILSMRATPGESSTTNPYIVQLAMREGKNRHADLMQDADAVRCGQATSTIMESDRSGWHRNPVLLLVRDTERETYEVTLRSISLKIPESNRYEKWCAGTEIQGEIQGIDSKKYMILHGSDIMYFSEDSDGSISRTECAEPFEPLLPERCELSDRTKLFVGLWCGIEVDQDFAEYLIFLGCKAELGEGMLPHVRCLTPRRI